MHHLRSRTGWVSIDIRLAYQTPRRAMSFRDRRILGHPPQSMSNRFALDLFRPTNSSSSGDAPVEHLGPGAPRSKEGSSRPLDRSFGFRRSIAAFRPEHLGSTPIEPDGSGFRNRSTPVRSQSNHRDNLIPSGTSFHVGRSNGPPWSSGARKGWHLRQPGRRVLGGKPCRFDRGFDPFYASLRSRTVSMSNGCICGAFRTCSLVDRDSTSTRRSSLVNPSRAKETTSRICPKSREIQRSSPCFPAVRSNAPRDNRGSGRCDGIPRDPAGHTWKDGYGRQVRTDALCHRHFTTCVDGTCEKTSLHAKRTHRKPLHDRCRSSVRHVRMPPRSAASLPLAATQNKKSFRNSGVRNLG